MQRLCIADKLRKREGTCQRWNERAIGGTPNVDILTRAWDLTWADARHGATKFDVEGVAVPTASIDDLIESKRTGRLQDAADIGVLEEIRRMRGA